MSTNDDARPRPHSRRFLLTAGLAGSVAAAGPLGPHAALAAISPSAPISGAASADPTFAAIADVKAKWAAYGKALQVRDEPETEEECDLSKDEAEALADDAMRSWADAEDALFRTVPTTPAGLGALMEAYWFCTVQQYGSYPIDGEHILGRLEVERELRQLRTLVEAGNAFAAAEGGRA